MRTLARAVGVAADSRYWGPKAEPDAAAYFPHTVAPQLRFVALHTTVPVQAVVAEVREELRRIDPTLPMTEVRTMQEAVDVSISWQRRILTVLAPYAPPRSPTHPTEDPSTT